MFEHMSPIIGWFGGQSAQRQLSWPLLKRHVHWMFA